jgi:uncharacterized protein
MIISFSVENFLSFKEEVTLSFVADPDDNTLEENLFSHPALPEGMKLLKSAVLYGANASGKSNFLNALTFFRNLIRKGHSLQLGQKLFTDYGNDDFTPAPFLLNAQKSNEDSRFIIQYLYKSVVYEYTIAFNNQAVTAESLKTQVENGEFQFVFDRRGQTIIYDSALPKKDEDLSTKQLEKAILSNNVLLAKAVSLGDTHLKEPFEGLHNHLWDWDRLSNSTRKALFDKTLDKSRLLRDLTQADFTITDVMVKKEEMPDEVYDALPEVIKEGLKQRPVGYRTSFSHQVEGLSVEFDLSQESEGTVRFFEMLGPLYEACRDGDFLFVDEIERHLHPTLLTKMIENFQEQLPCSEDRAHCSQLLMTTHSTELLDPSLFRKDQIWFASKNRETQASELYSLLEIEGIPEGADIRQEYLQGRYGAIPIVSSTLFSTPDVKEAND